MSRSPTSIYHLNFTKSDKQAVEAKLQILRDFYIVDHDNQQEISDLLFAAIKANADKDRDRILDREAKKLIEQKLK